MDQNKVINAILYAITEDPNIGRTQLMKYIFFCDLFSYNTLKSPILEDLYIKRDFGPVPNYAFSITWDSNKFFNVKKQRILGEQTTFHALIKSEMSLFSQYEYSLLNFVLNTIKKKTATSVSNFSHLRLWEEAEDLALIETDAFELNSDEIKSVQDYGFYFPEYQKDFCWHILELTKKINKAIHPISKTYVQFIEGFLDRYIRKYPKDELSIFYDAYLAWDDVFRSAIREEPQIVRNIAFEFCEAFSTVIMETHVTKPTLDPETYTKKFENKLDTLYDMLIEKRMQTGSEPPSGILNNLIKQSHSETFRQT